MWLANRRCKEPLCQTLRGTRLVRRAKVGSRTEKAIARGGEDSFIEVNTTTASFEDATSVGKTKRSGSSFPSAALHALNVHPDVFVLRIAHVTSSSDRTLRKAASPLNSANLFNRLNWMRIQLLQSTHPNAEFRATKLPLFSPQSQTSGLLQIMIKSLVV